MSSENTADNDNEISSLVLILIVFATLITIIILLIAVLNYLTKKQKLKQNAQALTKTNPTKELTRELTAQELRREMTELISPTNNLASFNGELDTESERRRVTNQVNGHETQMQHENNCQLRVKESLGINYGEGVVSPRPEAHSEGGF